MGFHSDKFIFDGIPGELYNLYVSTPDGENSENSSSNNVEPVEEYLFKRAKPYLLGVKQNQPLEFDITFTSPDEITAIDAQLISKWLFGQMGYKKLQVRQFDLEGVYFNCFLLNPRMIRVGNIIHGFSATVHCDAPWGWTFDKNFEQSYDIDSVNTSVSILNESNDNNYLYPTIEIIINSLGGDVYLYNRTEYPIYNESKGFSFTGLFAEEKIIVDNDLQIITSYMKSKLTNEYVKSSLKRLSVFSKNWMRLLPGLNQIFIRGNVKNIKFTYKFAKKIGG